MLLLPPPPPRPARRSALGADGLRGRLRVHACIRRIRGLFLPHFPRVIVDKVFPLAEAAAAHALMEDNKNTGKIVLQVDGGASGKDEL